MFSESDWSRSAFILDWNACSDSEPVVSVNPIVGLEKQHLLFRVRFLLGIAERSEWQSLSIRLI